MDGQVDDHMDDQSGAPVLSAVEREAAESLLGDAWGTPVEVGMAEVVWKGIMWCAWVRATAAQRS